MVAYPTDEALLNLDYREFFDLIVLEKMNARAMVEGPNFYFGKNREGDVAKLHELCAQHRIELCIADPLKIDEALISSSRIRGLIRDGQVSGARVCLTEPYRIRGMVTHGSARGKAIGFPTANLDAVDTLLPAPGVYAGRAFEEGRQHWAAIHIGANPTFREKRAKVEVHVLDFERSLYGEVLEVDFLERLRSIQKFASPEELVSQVNRDVERTREIALQFSQSNE